MSLSEKDRRIAYGLLKHLRSQLDNGVIQGDPAESVEGKLPKCSSMAKLLARFPANFWIATAIVSRNNLLSGPIISLCVSWYSCVLWYQRSA